jgi:hypothetical protein
MVEALAHDLFMVPDDQQLATPMGRAKVRKAIKLHRAVHEQPPTPPKLSPHMAMTQGADECLERYRYAMDTRKYVLGVCARWEELMGPPTKEEQELLDIDEA